MAEKIEWTEQALEDFLSIILYLQTSWTVEIADNFINLTETKLLTLAHQPLLGLRSEKMTDIRSVSLTKHNRLYYQFKADKLIMLNIFDTRQDPEKNKF